MCNELALYPDDPKCECSDAVKQFKQDFSYIKTGMSEKNIILHLLNCGLIVCYREPLHLLERKVHD